MFDFHLQAGQFARRCAIFRLDVQRRLPPFGRRPVQLNLHHARHAWGETRDHIADR